MNAIVNHIKIQGVVMLNKPKLITSSDYNIIVLTKLIQPPVQETPLNGIDNLR